jgi:hypothetical protein
MSYLRFTPKEFRAIRRACRSLDLNDDFFVVFKYFLVESLTGPSASLTQKLAHLPRHKLRILCDYLREQKPSSVEKHGWLRKGGTQCALTFEELQTVRQVSGVFFLHDGSLHSFQDYLVYAFRKSAPGLAARLDHLSQQQIESLFYQVKQPRRWIG